MLCLLFVPIVLASQPAAAKWEFRDEAAYAGRSLLTFRAVELGDSPVSPLAEGDRPAAKAQYGLLPIGTESSEYPALVWLPEVGQVWLDGDGDGRFAAAERHALGAAPLEIPVLLSIRNAGEKPQRLKRTIILRRAADGGLRYAVRGYVAGTIRFGNKDYAALLTDGNGDGCFDSAAHDRIWIDLDRDGKFDGLTEQFPLGKPLTVGTKTYLIKPRPDGGAAEVRERPTETGTLRLQIADKPGIVAKAFSAQLVSDWGELVTIEEADKAAALPTGRYSVDALTFQVVDADGRKWLYHFAGSRRLDIEVAAGKETSAAVLRGLQLAVKLDVGADGVRPGDEVCVTPTLQTPGGLVLVSCQTSDRGRDRFVSGHADIRLVGAAGKTLGVAESGFL
jgi:hypothetical protein